jgi:hypothetical protein
VKPSANTSWPMVRAAALEQHHGRRGSLLLRVGLAIVILMMMSLAVEAAVVLRCKSSITGKFVSVAQAKASPDTTWCQFRRK